jgi:hypothetical protein
LLFVSTVGTSASRVALLTGSPWPPALTCTLSRLTSSWMWDRRTITSISLMVCLFFLGLLWMMKCYRCGRKPTWPRSWPRKGLLTLYVTPPTGSGTSTDRKFARVFIHMYLHVSGHESCVLWYTHTSLAIINKCYCCSDLAVTVVLLEEYTVKQWSKRRCILCTISLLIFFSVQRIHEWQDKLHLCFGMAKYQFIILLMRI